MSGNISFIVNGVKRNCSLEKFPDVLQDCSHLEYLDLSVGDTNLGKLPLSFAKLKNLRELDMRNCSLEKFPDGLEDCVHLEVLHLSFNANLGKLPFTVPKLKNLRTLVMRNCSLEKFPDGLEACVNLENLDLSGNDNLGKLPFPKLKNLRTLGMSGCSLEKFPDGLGDCINLEDLDFSYNTIDVFPDAVLELPNLVKLNMSSNRLTELSESFTNLIDRNVKFNLKGNVLGTPPQVICENPGAILKYFQDIKKFGKAHSKRLRMLVIGNTRAGKTSLVKGLLLGESRLTRPEERTEGIEIRRWFPDPADKDLELEIWDFGGHMEYQTVSHYFMEEKSLFLLVVDISEYEISDESYYENTGKWIDEVKSIVPRPVVVVVATKCDRIDSSLVKDKCDHMLAKIVKQEDMDIKLIRSDIEKLEENADLDDKHRIDKLKLLLRNRPVLPTVFVSQENNQYANAKTVIVAASAGDDKASEIEDEDSETDDEAPESEDDASEIEDEDSEIEDEDSETVDEAPESEDDASEIEDEASETVDEAPESEDEDSETETTPMPRLKLLKEELFRTGSNTVLFPHLQDTLPSLWVEIEKLLATWRNTKYLKLVELEKWLCEKNQDFEEDDDKKNTLNSILLYLAGLGKVLRFAHLEELKELVFPDPQWLIMLVKDVVHHDLPTHLQYKEVFRACNMDDVKFGEEKKELIDHGLLSESLLRCIWYDAVPEEADFKKLAPLLYHFDVGYEMTLKEAKIEDKEIKNRYTFIPALMPETHPDTIRDVWPTHASEDQWETKSIYKFHSRVPVGLFERQMVRCHQGSDYMLHSKEGFLGAYNMDESEEVKFCITKKTLKSEIEFSARIGKCGQLNTLWKAVIHLHWIFAKMVKELWPELRYNIYNKCDQCNQCHHEMDFERLLKTPESYEKTFVCTKTSRPAKVTNKLVFPPKEVVEAFKIEIAEPTGSEVVEAFNKEIAKPTGSEVVEAFNKEIAEATGSGIAKLTSNRFGHPPSLSKQIPKLKDIQVPKKPWENVALPVDVLLLTVEDDEFLACVAHLGNIIKSHSNKIGWVYFGEIGHSQKKGKVALVRSFSGSSQVGASQNVVGDAVECLKPKVVFSVGHCGGLRRDKTKLGDVVISAKLTTYDDKEIIKDQQIWCGHTVNVSRHVGNLIKSAADGWRAPLNDPEALEVEVHRDAEILSGPKLSDSPEARTRIIEEFPGAVAVESEGQGLYAAAYNSEIEWAVIKGISHYVDVSESETEKWEPFACVMAASIVEHIFNEPDVLKGWSHYNGKKGTKGDHKGEKRRQDERDSSYSSTYGESKRRKDLVLMCELKDQ